MIGSDNVWNVNQTKDLGDFDSAIKSSKTSTPCAGETSELPALARTCRGCAEPFITFDGRRHFCSSRCQRKNFRASLRRRQAEYRERFPERSACRQTLKNAILRGKVRRCTRCEQCGAVGFTDGHHTDYAKPLYVTWLCKACHAGLEDGQHFGCGEFKHAETVTAEVAAVPVPNQDGINA